MATSSTYRLTHGHKARELPVPSLSGAPSSPEAPSRGAQRAVPTPPHTGPIALLSAHPPARLAAVRRGHPTLDVSSVTAAPAARLAPEDGAHSTPRNRAERNERRKVVPNPPQQSLPKGLRSKGSCKSTSALPFGGSRREGSHLTPKVRVMQECGGLWEARGLRAGRGLGEEGRATGHPALQPSEHLG